VISDHALSRLLSLISHEVRGPLGVVRGYLKLIEQQSASLSDLHRQAVTATLKATDRATDLLGQVSTLARLYRGEVTPVFSPVPLDRLVREAVDGLALPPEPRITVDVGATPPVSVRGDEALLRGALTSLVTAVARAQPADARIHLVTRVEEEGARDLTLTITAMEPISTAHQDTSLDLSRGGLGIELPIAAFIIDAHNGRLRERRDNGRFAGVVVWLPTA
jgi:signal transduction histidine kinase